MHVAFVLSKTLLCGVLAAKVARLLGTKKSRSLPQLM